MKQITMAFLSLGIALASCKSKTAEKQPLTASEYYETVADMEETMSEPLLKAEAEIKVRGDKKDFDGIAKSAKAMEDTIDIRINAIKNMEAPGIGGDDFKTVAVRYFEYVKSIYTTYKKIGDGKTDEERMKAADEMTKIINSQQAVMTNLQLEQNKYASANHFTIDPQ